MSDVILAKVSDIIRDILNEESAVITPETTANDLAEWDSLNNLQILMAIEKFYKVKFKTTEIRGWRNVGEMCDSIAKATRI